MSKVNLSILWGDITVQEVDVIVNSIHPSCQPGLGEAGAIHRQGGPAIYQECRQIHAQRGHKDLDVGEYIVTNPGRLLAKQIVHISAPRYFESPEQAQPNLTECYVSIINYADSAGFKSMAIPAIGTGVFRFPFELAMEAALIGIQEACAQCHSLEEIRLVFFKEHHYQQARVMIKQFIQSLDNSS